MATSDTLLSSFLAAFSAHPRNSTGRHFFFFVLFCYQLFFWVHFVIPLFLYSELFYSFLFRSFEGNQNF
jgi:hypothetical protein